MCLSSPSPPTTWPEGRGWKAIRQSTANKTNKRSSICRIILHTSLEICKAHEPLQWLESSTELRQRKMPSMKRSRISFDLLLYMKKISFTAMGAVKLSSLCLFQLLWERYAIKCVIWNLHKKHLNILLKAPDLASKGNVTFPFTKISSL